MESINEPSLTSDTHPTTGPRPIHSAGRNADRGERGAVMGGPGDNYDVYKYSQPVSVVRRRSLDFAPRSTARHNFGLLPNLKAMAGMSLAYRHQAFRSEEIEGAAHDRVVWLFVWSTILPVVAIVAGRHLPPGPSFGIAWTISVVWMAWMVFFRVATLRGLFYALLVPMTCIALVKFIAWAFMHRVNGTAGAALIAAYFIARNWKLPFDFYLDWLYTHPRLKPSTRERPMRVTSTEAPDWKLLSAILIVIVALPLFSTWLTIGVLALTPLLILRGPMTVRGFFKPMRDLVRGAVHVLSPFVTYGGSDALAPGVWRASQPFGSRMKALTKLCVPFMVTLSMGLTLFIPLGDHYLKRIGSAEYGINRFPWHERVYNEQPAQWLEFVWKEIFDKGNWEFAGFGVLAILFAAYLPAALLVTVFRRPLRFVLRLRVVVEGGVDHDGKAHVGLDNDGRTEWQWYVDRIKDSRHVADGALFGSVREAYHHFLGVEPHANFPVLLDKALLTEHCYMVGDSGSGKTSLGLMPMIIQLIRGHTGEGGARTDCPPIVILDLKGDPALFQLAKREADARGVPFRVFTPEKGKPSHYFNPFVSLESKYRTDIQLCNLLMDALSLNHGEGYGRGYYGRQSRSLLLKVMEDAANAEGGADEETETVGRRRPKAKKKPNSFEELYAKLKEVRGDNEKEFKDTLELLSTVEALTKYKMLARATSATRIEDAIHMPTVLEQNQVVYFYLPAAVESISVREIAKLALYSLLTACIDRQREHPGKPKQAYLIIDEFQRIAGENFRVILEQARSYGLSVTLANQSIADLKTPDTDLRPTVRTNTRVKRIFSLSDPQDVKSMVDSSGEELMYVRSWTQKAGGSHFEMVSAEYETKTDAQAIKPRLTQNDVMAISDHPLDSILLVSRGSGYTQFAGLPIAVRSVWPLSEAEDATLRTEKWPDIEDLGGEASAAINNDSPLSIDADHEERLAAVAVGFWQSRNGNRA
ncbi:hypothetical protein LBMAG48_10690 [Phycisphaerae bacterium]|nr:hypothetical protein LBMAG48_10690 [Phycisphaerae bacterium]